jgi:putative flippase GtrA
MLLTRARGLKEETDTPNFFRSEKNADLARFVKFAATGVLNTAVDFAAFVVLSYLGVQVYTAQIISYAAGMLNSYAVNRSWTFRSQEGFFSPVMLRFIAANLSLLALSLAVIWLVHGQLGLPKLPAKAGATCMTVVLGFAVNRLWVFKK